MSTSIQIVSDLHLEVSKAYDVYDIEPKAPYLALLGDIGNVAKHRSDFFDFLTRQLRNFQAVLFVPGNHEAYHSSWPETVNLLRNFEQTVQKDRQGQPLLGQFVLLERGLFRLPGDHPSLIILGCSLFSAIPPASETDISMGLNDFYDIAGWDVAAHHEAHQRDLAWLNAQIKELPDDAEAVILSHWCPSVDSRAADPRHANSPISSAFSTDLSQELCFQSAKVHIWTFGHTHYNCDFQVDRPSGRPLRLVANQRGYYFAQAAGFAAEKTMIIGQKE